MSDLIRRDAVLDILSDEGWLGDSFRRIAALPAVQPDAHVNETPKSEHEAENMLTLDAAAIREALKAAESWLERWAVHVGNCAGGRVCTCGLTLVQYETGAALKGAEP
jgi:hypothetical protein